MSRVKQLAVAAGLASLLLAGCGTKQAPPPGPPPYGGTATPRPSGNALSAADYVSTAGSIDLFVIKASEMAQSRSSSVAIRRLAGELIAGHKGTSGQLSLAGRRLDLLPGSTVQEPYRRMLDELTLSVAFDRLYLDHMITAHRQSVAIHANFAARGQSPTLRPVARNAEAIERRHLAQLRAVR